MASTDSIIEYTYNGLGQRISERTDSDTDNDIDANDDVDWFQYDDRWRIVAVYRNTNANAAERYVWQMAGVAGSSTGMYIDSMVVRDRDAAADGTYEERRYVLQNWRADVSCIIEDDGEVIEWVRYTPYGVAYSIPWINADRNGDDGIDDLDDGDFATDFANEHPSADLNRNGEWASGDITLWNTAYSEGIKAEWALAPQTGLRFGYAGYVHDGSVDMYHVRHRVYRQDLGRWLTRDPARMHWWGLYEYGRSTPVHATDPSGLLAAVACNRQVLATCQTAAFGFNVGNGHVCISARRLANKSPQCVCAWPLLLVVDIDSIAACLRVRVTTTQVAVAAVAISVTWHEPITPPETCEQLLGHALLVCSQTIPCSGIDNCPTLRVKGQGWSACGMALLAAEAVCGAVRGLCQHRAKHCFRPAFARAPWLPEGVKTMTSRLEFVAKLIEGTDYNSISQGLETALSPSLDAWHDVYIATTKLCYDKCIDEKLVQAAGERCTDLLYSTTIELVLCDCVRVQAIVLIAGLSLAADTHGHPIHYSVQAAYVPLLFSLALCSVGNTDFECLLISAAFLETLKTWSRYPEMRLAQSLLCLHAASQKVAYGMNSLEPRGAKEYAKLSESLREIVELQYGDVHRTCHRIINTWSAVKDRYLSNMHY